MKEQIKTTSRPLLLSSIIPSFFAYVLKNIYLFGCARS